MAYSNIKSSGKYNSRFYYDLKNINSSGGFIFWNSGATRWEHASTLGGTPIIAFLEGQKGDYPLSIKDIYDWKTVNGNLFEILTSKEGICPDPPIPTPTPTQQPVPPYFEGVFDTNLTIVGSSNSNSLTLPFVNDGVYDVYIDWDAPPTPPTTIQSTWERYVGTTGPRTRTYQNPGKYIVRVYANPNNFIGWRYGGSNELDRTKILHVNKWGPIRLQASGTSNVGAYFSGCTNLNLTGTTDVLNTLGTTAFTSMFEGCVNLTCINRVNEWDTSNVTLMNRTFRDANKYNCDLSGWTTSLVTNMSSMFERAWVFDRNIGNWNTSLCTDMSSMFSEARAFDNFGSDTINSWNTSNVTNMGYMFYNTRTNPGRFNRNIGSWNVSKVTNMGYMFHRQQIFNNNGSNTINNWNTSAVTFMGHMFAYAFKFNQPIGNWDVRKVTTVGGEGSNGFYATFKEARDFNQNLGSWDVRFAKEFGETFNGTTSFNNLGSPTIGNWITSAVTRMSFMFLNSSFNQPIGNWDVSKVTNMKEMFKQSSFNQPIGTWNVTSVENMNGMFANSTNFNQDISNWNPTACTDFRFFMTGKTTSNYSTTNYDALLNSWAGKSLKSNLTADFGTIKYTSAGLTGRNTLINTKGWTITDGEII